ncbi:MAG: phage tail protein [Bacteroidia bacterium]
MALNESNSYDAAFPVAAFNFAVSINGSFDDSDAEFQEVSGLEVEMEVEEISEGGRNTHKLRLPGRTRFSNLVLKRGLIKQDSPLADWCKATINGDLNEKIQLRNLEVQLRDENQEPLMTWAFRNAYPVKWRISNFNAQENGIVTETIEFAYQTYEQR